jgi:tetratricopeptide (TPR) repeat protein
MMTTKKRRRCHCNLIVVAAVATLLTACSPPGARELRQGERDIQSRELANAIAELRDATRILNDAPRAEQAKAWNLLGLACQESGHLDDAAKAYLTALKLDRDNVAVVYNLGCLRSQQTNFPGAIDYLTTYVTLRRRDLQGFLQLGTARFHYALEKRGTESYRLLEAARRDFENAEAVSPSAYAANALGIIEMQRRPFSADSIHAAARDFTLALQRDKNNTSALLNLAIVSQQYLNQPAQALSLYQRYLAIQPPLPHVKEIAKLAHDLDVKQRIIIGPETTPAHASAPSPPPAKTNFTPSSSIAATPKPLPAESPPAQAVVPATNPAPPPAAASASAQNSTPLSSPQTPTETASTPNISNSVPDPVVTDAAPPPRKSIGQRLNPLNWLSGQPQPADSGAALAAEPPPLPAGSRYEWPKPSARNTLAMSLETSAPTWTPPRPTPRFTTPPMVLDWLR